MGPVGKTHPAARVDQRGQGLIETIFILPLIMTLTLSFFIFIYEQLWSQTVEYVLHEALICEATLKDNRCLLKANEAVRRSRWLGRTFLYRTPEAYHAQLMLIRKWKWKTITVKLKDPTFSKNKRVLR